MLGLAHASGAGGVAADATLAKSFLRVAAAARHKDAAYNLVALCDGRPGCLEATTTEQALSWLQEAARQGHPQAAYEAGHLLLRVGKEEEALEAFLRAARSGHPGAQYNAGSLLYKARLLNAAIGWFQKASAQEVDAKVAADAAVALQQLADAGIDSTELKTEL